MFVHIDPSDGLAIYDQIVRQIKFAVAAGALATGELAPSVRELARDLAVNPNTVARAYQQLQADRVSSRSVARGWQWRRRPGGAAASHQVAQSPVAASDRGGPAEWPAAGRVTGTDSRRVGGRRREMRCGMDPAIQFKRVTKLYGRQVALANVSFEVPRGVVFALLGENGRGRRRPSRSCWAWRRGRGKVPRARFRQPAAGTADPPVRRLRPGATHALRVDDRGGDRLVHGRLLRELFPPALPPVDLRFPSAVAAAAEDYLQGHAGESGAVPGDGSRPATPGARRTDVGAGSARPARVPGEHGGPGGTGKTVFLASHQIHEVERIADIVAILREGQLCLVEKLATLKQQFREVTLTLTGNEEPPRALGARCCASAGERQWQGLVRNVADDVLAGLRGSSSVAAVDIRTPSLEEILVGYLRRESPQEEISDKQEVLP